MHEISLHRIKEYMCTVGGAETNCEQQPKTSTGFPEVQRLKSINTTRRNIWSEIFSDLCIKRSRRGKRPEGWPPSLLRIGTTASQQHCSWAAALSKGGKSKTSKEAGGTSDRPIPSCILLNFKVKQATGYIKCSASQRLLTFANI